MGNGEQHSTYIQAIGNKHLNEAMKQQAENLKFQQQMIDAQVLIATINNDTEKLRLELAQLLVENPQIVEAMEVSGTTLPTEPQAPIDTEGSFQVEEPATIPENIEAQGEAETGSFSGNENQTAQA